MHRASCARYTSSRTLVARRGASVGRSILHPAVPAPPSLVAAHPREILPRHITTCSGRGTHSGRPVRAPGRRLKGRRNERSRDGSKTRVDVAVCGYPDGGVGCKAGPRCEREEGGGQAPSFRERSLVPYHHVPSLPAAQDPRGRIRRSLGRPYRLACTARTDLRVATSNSASSSR